MQWEGRKLFSSWEKQLLLIKVGLGMMLKIWRRIMVEKHQDTKFCELYILISHLCYWRQKQEINGFK